MSEQFESARDIINDANEKLKELSDKGYVTPREHLDALEPIRSGYNWVPEDYEFETTYDPDKRIIPRKEGQRAKADAGKPKLSLVPTKIIFAIEKIRSYGNAKYPEGGINNWKTVESERHFEAMLRHAAKCWNNPYAIDPESELPHMFHMACDMAFFIEQNWDDFETAIDVHKFNVEYEEKHMKNKEVSHESTVSSV